MIIEKAKKINRKEIDSRLKDFLDSFIIAFLLLLFGHISRTMPWEMMKSNGLILNRLVYVFSELKQDLLGDNNVEKSSKGSKWW